MEVIIPRVPTSRKNLNVFKRLEKGMPKTRLLSKTHISEKNTEIDLIVNVDLQGKMAMCREFLHDLTDDRLSHSYVPVVLLTV